MSCNRTSQSWFAPDLHRPGIAPSYRTGTTSIHVDSAGLLAQSPTDTQRTYRRSGNPPRICGSVLDSGFQCINIADSQAGIGQPIFHRPKTSSWDFTFPALQSRRASRMLRRYSGEVAAMRSSRKSCRSFFLIFFTAWITVTAFTSIRKAVAISQPFPHWGIGMYAVRTTKKSLVGSIRSPYHSQ